MISAVFSGVRRIFFISLMLFIVSGLFTFVQAQTKISKSTYIVIGTGKILKDNITAAREEAISNSLVSAVGLAAAEFMSVDLFTTNGEALDKILFNRAKKYVQGYKVLSEIRSDKAYRVTVQVNVSADGVKKRLSRAGLLRAKKKSLKILFFIAEQKTQEEVPRYWWGNEMAFSKPVSEKAISEVMKEKGIHVVEHGPEIQRMAVKNMGNSPELNIRSAANLAAKLNADVFGVGKSIASTTPNSMGDDRTFKGTVTIDVFKTKSMQKIASANRTAVMANIDEAEGSRAALKSAGNLIANDLSSQIIAALEKVSQDASRVDIFLEGTSNLANFVMFRRMLKKVQGVDDIQVRELKSDNATLNIKYRGSTKKLAETLMLNAFETFGINIYKIEAATLRIKLIPNKI